MKNNAKAVSHGVFRTHGFCWSFSGVAEPRWRSICRRHPHELLLGPKMLSK